MKRFLVALTVLIGIFGMVNVVNAQATTNIEKDFQPLTTCSSRSGRR